MTDQLGTRDVMDQLNARLSNVEQSVGQLRSEIATRFGQVDSRLEQLQAQLLADRRMLLGILVASWLSTMVSIWLKG